MLSPQYHISCSSSATASKEKHRPGIRLIHANIFTMSSSQAVSRTEGPSSATWEMHKETIKKLYIKENMPLKDVIDIMRVDHGLVAR